jgi:hypothetical protein
MAIYIVAPESGGGPFKIGYSNNVPRRLIALQTGSPVPLVVLNVLPGNRDTEKFLHWVFEGKRSHGEWFNLTDKEMILLMRMVADNLLIKGQEEQLVDLIVEYLTTELHSDDNDEVLNAAAIAIHLRPERL